MSKGDVRGGPVQRAGPRVQVPEWLGPSPVLRKSAQGRSSDKEFLNGNVAPALLKDQIVGTVAVNNG